MKIVFLGNFEVPYSTESHHAWTWEKMGHKVVRLQENRCDPATVLQHCDSETRVFQWTHTHGWPDYSQAMVDEIRARGIKSFSYHLDRYFGIGSRQASYLSHPSFHLDYFFSTDGGNEAGWKAAGINHVYMPPGVVEYGVYLGQGPVDNAKPVVFAGSVGYHAEYPFRPNMVSRLYANYGEKFQVIAGVREVALNNAYAKARVIVGDHIFAGQPLYVSDRLFETVGRGGFIIYPDTPGVTDLIPGLVTYKPQDVDDLIRKIDYFLDIGHEPERLERRNTAFEWVKANGTYTNRLGEILKVMGL